MSSSFDSLTMEYGPLHGPVFPSDLFVVARCVWCACVALQSARLCGTGTTSCSTGSAGHDYPRDMFCSNPLSRSQPWSILPEVRGMDKGGGRGSPTSWTACAGPCCGLL